MSMKIYYQGMSSRHSEKTLKTQGMRVDLLLRTLILVDQAGTTWLLGFVTSSDGRFRHV